MLLAKRKHSIHWVVAVIHHKLVNPTSEYLPSSDGMDEAVIRVKSNETKRLYVPMNASLYAVHLLLYVAHNVANN